ncbi:hypothetical protein HPP92_014249 [Vanilla planifolia]|uniref:FAD linked oxidase N-terminal domain-containing protein n=1 Tax=Vanilla planifolia TaxID=51239 RepID=A0A835QZT6_VANPL|nr:hypothetical protein HPP92_014249 [Vanilla planifolia]
MRASPILKLFVALLLTGINSRKSDPDASYTSLSSLDVDGRFTFDDVSEAAMDFGHRYHHLPSAVLHPGSVTDVAETVRHVFQLGPGSRLTVAARGHGHSLQGQAQAAGGIVVRMESLRRAQEMRCMQEMNCTSTPRPARSG